MPVQELPILGYYDKQRFVQYNPSDCANWYIAPDPLGKKKAALYPVMGRKHISFLGINRLIFDAEPRAIFKSINFVYFVVVNEIFRMDKFYNLVRIDQGKVTSFNGDVFFDYLVVSDLPGQPSITYAVFVDGEHIYVHREEDLLFQIVTDPNAPPNPTHIVAFGNRFAVCGTDTSQFNLSEINLGGNLFVASTCWTVAGKPVFAQEAGVIKGFAVLHNKLYIFTDFTTGTWTNTVSTFLTTGNVTVTFPWKKNAIDWDYGLTDANSLDIGFNMIAWEGQNREGLVQVLACSGEAPVPISDDSIGVLFQQLTSTGQLSPFLTSADKDGFLYSWENTVFYRLSAGDYDPTTLLLAEDIGNTIEYNFSTKTWTRPTELNGQRNRIQKHTFFNNVHLVTVIGDTTVYQMAGNVYFNERSNPARLSPQDPAAYLAEPFRYVLTTRILSEDDYSEFMDEYAEIDFVWGFKTFIRSTNPFENAVFLIDEQPGGDGNPQFIIDEQPGPDGNPVFILGEEGNFPTPDSLIYNNWFKPHIELFFSDDGGVSFMSADVLEFSQLGVYQWRMRWYQLGASRNRVYRLVAVSPSPIVVLGGIVVRRRISGGAN